MQWVEPIYDRVLADVTNRTDKGFFNVSDWERINNNGRLLVALIHTLREDINIELQELTVPTMSTIPTAENINDFVDNIDIAQYRDELGIPSIIELATLEKNYIEGVAGTSPNYEAINDWEQNIEIIRNYLININYYAIYCGVGVTGFSRLWQVRFRDWNYVGEGATPSRLARAGVSTCGLSLAWQNKFRKYD